MRGCGCQCGGGVFPCFGVRLGNSIGIMSLGITVLDFLDVRATPSIVVFEGDATHR